MQRRSISRRRESQSKSPTQLREEKRTQHPPPYHKKAQKPHASGHEMQCPSPFVNKTDIAVVLMCYTPMCIAVYACCYAMLAQMHPGETKGYTALSVYGCMQSVIGYTSGYFTARWIYYSQHHHQPPLRNSTAGDHHPQPEQKRADEEEHPLLPLSTAHPPAVDIEEALAA
jgi:hypothetical protein